MASFAMRDELAKQPLFATTAKHSDRPKRQLFIDPRIEADSLLSAQFRSSLWD